MDHFERRLSVALKTAARELPVDLSPAARPVDVVAERRAARGRSQVLLAAAVAVLLVVGVAGTWWAIEGTHDHHATPAGAACTADDVTATQVDTRGQKEAAIGPTASIEVRATSACTLLTTPTLFLDATPVYWRSSDPDAVDPAAWVPIPLAAGGRATFELRIASLGGRANCLDMAERTTTFRFGVDAADLLTFRQTAITGCSSYWFTTVYPSPPPAADASLPCTAADLDVVPHDIGDGIDGVGFDVVSKVGCTLQQSPTVTVDGARTQGTVRGNPVPPWQRTRIAARQSVTLVVNPNYFGPCQALGPHEVRVEVGGTQLSRFAWTSITDCPGLTFGLEPRGAVRDAAHPCTADLVTASVDPSVTPASVRISAAGDTSCTLVDPPTVTVGDTVAAFGSADDGYRYGGGWPGPTVGPGETVVLVLGQAVAPSPANCPRNLPTYDVTVSVGGGMIGSGSVPRPACVSQPFTHLP